MKYTHIAALIGSITMMTAQSFGQAQTPTTPDPRRRISNISAPVAEAQPPTTFEARTLAIADLRNIRLNALSGSMLFTAAGTEYEYDPSSGSGDSYSHATKISACLALLTELRRTETFVVQVPIRPDLPSDRKQVRITELTISIDKLK